MPIPYGILSFRLVSTQRVKWPNFNALPYSTTTTLYLTLTLNLCLRTMDSQRVFDTVICLNRIATLISDCILSRSSTDITDLWHFAHFAQLLSRALELNSSTPIPYTLAPRLEQVTPQSGEEKTSCHIFSVDLFANGDFGPLHCSVLRCTEKEEKNYSCLLYSLVFLISKLIALSRL